MSQEPQQAESADSERTDESNGPGFVRILAPAVTSIRGWSLLVLLSLGERAG